MLWWLSHGEGKDAVTWCGWDKLQKGRNYWTSRLSCQVYGLRGVSWWLCVCVLPDFTWLPLLGVGRKSWYIIINVLKQPNWELLVAVNHKKLRTMASETVDPIDWSHPTPSWAVPPERHVHNINQCNLSRTRTCNRSVRRGNHLAYAATQWVDGKKQSGQ